MLESCFHSLSVNAPFVTNLSPASFAQSSFPSTEFWFTGKKNGNAHKSRKYGVTALSLTVRVFPSSEATTSSAASPFVSSYPANTAQR